jgi:hypothetical protein
VSIQIPKAALAFQTIQPSRFTAWRLFVSRSRSPVFELARVRVRLDHIASIIVNRITV